MFLVILIQEQDTFVKLLETLKSLEIAQLYFPHNFFQTCLLVPNSLDTLRECMRNYIQNNHELFHTVSTRMEWEERVLQLQHTAGNCKYLIIEAGTIVLKDSLKEMYMYMCMHPEVTSVCGEILIDPRSEITNIQTETENYIREWNRIEQLEEDQEYLENDLSFWNYVGCFCIQMYSWWKNLICYIRFIPFLNPLFAAQAFEYKIKYIFDKCFESAFGILNHYQGDFYQKPFHYKNFTMYAVPITRMDQQNTPRLPKSTFLPSSLAVHGAQKTIAELILERNNLVSKTWIHSLKVFKSSKNVFMILHHVSIVLASIFSIPMFGIVIRYVTNEYIYYTYIFLLICTIVLSLFKNPRSLLWVFQTYVILFGILAYCMYSFLTYLIVKEINSFSVLFLSLGCIFVFIQLVFGSTLYISLTLPSFLFYFPTYIHMFMIYSVLHTPEQDKKRAFWLFVNAVVYFVSTHFADFMLMVLLYMYISIITFHLFGVFLFKVQQLFQWTHKVQYLCTHPHPLFFREQIPISNIQSTSTIDV